MTSYRRQGGHITGLQLTAAFQARRVRSERPIINEDEDRRITRRHNRVRARTRASIIPVRLRRLLYGLLRDSQEGVRVCGLLLGDGRLQIILMCKQAK